MAELGAHAVRPKAVVLPASAWGAGVDGLTGDRLFTVSVDGRPVSRRYRAPRLVTLVGASGRRHQSLADGVGGLFTVPSERRHGYGAALMSLSIESSRREGYVLGLLCCLSSMEPWYRRLGWWLTRDLPVRYRTHRGVEAHLHAPHLWMGLLALSPHPEFSTLTRIEIEGPMW